MKVRSAIARTAPRTRRTAIGWAFLAVLVFAAVSACTSASGSPTTFVPSGGSGSPGVASNANETTTETTTSSPTATPTITVTVTAPPTYISPVPTAAPVTGGGGTAGLQDGALFLIGGAAIVVGGGSIFYRRKLNKDR
jgi:hypothetical protein